MVSSARGRSPARGQSDHGAGAGSDAQALQLAARRDPTGYSLSGEKTEVAFATEADAALVYGRVEEGRRTE